VDAIFSLYNTISLTQNKNFTAKEFVMTEFDSAHQFSISLKRSYNHLEEEPVSAVSLICSGKTSR
jgi:hypothetical protein